jgi:hypothetical protein
MKAAEPTAPEPAELQAASLVHADGAVEYTGLIADAMRQSGTELAVAEIGPVTAA